MKPARPDDNWITDSLREAGFTHFQPEVRCKTESLKPYKRDIACEPLILPIARLPQIVAFPEETIPAGWCSAIACPSCGHVYSYRADDVGWLQLRLPSPEGQYCADTRCFAVDSACSDRRCPERVRFHATGANLTEAEVRSRLRRGFYLYECGRRHSLQPVPEGSFRVGAEPGPLW